MIDLHKLDEAFGYGKGATPMCTCVSMNLRYIVRRRKRHIDHGRTEKVLDIWDRYDRRWMFPYHIQPAWGYRTSMMGQKAQQMNRDADDVQQYVAGSIY